MKKLIFDGKKYENDSKYNYKYFEFEKNPNYIIQVAYNLNIINHNNTNVMEQLFDLVSSNIDNNESIYNMDRNYHLINLASEEIYELDCENLLYDEYAKFVHFPLHTSEHVPHSPYHNVSFVQHSLRLHSFVSVISFILIVLSVCCMLSFKFSISFSVFENINSTASFFYINM